MTTVNIEEAELSAFLSPGRPLQSILPISVPITLVLNTTGLNLMNLNSAKNGKSIHGYEMGLKDYNPEVIQKLIVQGCLDRIDISLLDVISHRSDIIDLTKLITFSVLYKQFRQEVFSLTVKSPLIKKWNRHHPKYQISSDSIQTFMKIETMLASHSRNTNSLRQNMLGELLKQHPKLFIDSTDQKYKKGMAGKLLRNIHPFTQLLFLSYWTHKDVQILRKKIIDLAAVYLKRFNLPEFNALMLLEYLQYSERENLFRKYRRTELSHGRLVKNMPFTEQIREDLIQQNLSPDMRFSFLFETRTNQEGGVATRLRMTVFSEEKEVRAVNDILFRGKSRIRLKKSIREHIANREFCFDKSFNSELLHHYMTHLEEECRRNGCNYSSFINYDKENSISITHLIFTC